jgi:hypothetical protein
MNHVKYILILCEAQYDEAKHTIKDGQRHSISNLDVMIKRLCIMLSDGNCDFTFKGMYRDHFHIIWSRALWNFTSCTLIYK